jgi:hypothetical protein
LHTHDARSANAAAVARAVADARTLTTVDVGDTDNERDVLALVVGDTDALACDDAVRDASAVATVSDGDVLALTDSVSDSDGDGDADADAAGDDERDTRPVATVPEGDTVADTLDDDTHDALVDTDGERESDCSADAEGDADAAPLSDALAVAEGGQYEPVEYDSAVTACLYAEPPLQAPTPSRPAEAPPSATGMDRLTLFDATCDAACAAPVVVPVLVKFSVSLAQSYTSVTVSEKLESPPFTATRVSLCAVDGWYDRVEPTVATTLLVPPL